jgi:hypothetical protein
VSHPFTENVVICHYVLVDILYTMIPAFLYFFNIKIFGTAKLRAQKFLKTREWADFESLFSFPIFIVLA